MNDNYVKELIQCAAVCLAAAQVRLYGNSDLDEPENLDRAQKLLGDVLAERQSQENKWGVRTAEDSKPEHWLTILLEEVGEWAEEIRADYTGHGMLIDGRTKRFRELMLIMPTIKLGFAARQVLESKDPPPVETVERPSIILPETKQ